MNPIRIPELDAYLDFIRGDSDKGISSSSDGCTDIGRDIFSELPPKIRLEILKRIPTTSILTLEAASPSMNATVLPSNLMKQVLKTICSGSGSSRMMPYVTPKNQYLEPYI
ncbi:hypothetical protein BDV23DRAFT_160854 [Aspergillus alliaceus]|uniref:F-box domain-containing protein n=1 Tax=Petromyces alliaceus TaxID=209559 RepID=A0A5N7C0D2_PETAA|nr:hypothetical protein BDV23DRAFT_160854 [Aspergillus alliaceus]